MIVGVFLSECSKESTPMAVDQSVGTELLEAVKTSDRVDLIRAAVRYIQELIESEATTVIGAGPNERCEGWVERVQRAPGDAGPGCRRLRRQGLLAGLPAIRALEGPQRRAVGHLGPALRNGGGHRALLPGEAHQRCRVHFARNLLPSVPKGQLRWWPRPSGPSSPSPPPKRRSRLSGTTWPPPWADASPRPLTSWRAPKRRRWPSAPSPRAQWRQLSSTKPVRTPQP